MKMFRLVFCLALFLALIVPVVHAYRDETIAEQKQQQYRKLIIGGQEQGIPVEKLTFKGSASCNCEGRWNTNWGEMSLTQAPDGQVTGTYTYDNGKIEGSISGMTFSGRWSESPSYQDPNDGGLVELEFSSDCKTFSGRWKYGTSGDWKENNWSGERITGMPKKLLYQ